MSSGPHEQVPPMQYESQHPKVPMHASPRKPQQESPSHAPLQQSSAFDQVQKPPPMMQFVSSLHTWSLQWPSQQSRVLTHGSPMPLPVHVPPPPAPVPPPPPAPIPPAPPCAVPVLAAAPVPLPAPSPPLPP